jgi:hypothetical protein
MRAHTAAATRVFGLALSVGFARDDDMITLSTMTDGCTLTAYRDAIDYIGYYRDTIGSMIDLSGSCSKDLT